MVSLSITMRMNKNDLVNIFRIYISLCEDKNNRIKK